MKKLFKLAAALCLAVVMAVSLAACNKNEQTSEAKEGLQVEGTWKKSLLKENEGAAAFYSDELNETMTLESNGSMTIRTMVQGKEVKQTGSWKLNGERLTVTNLEAEGNKQDKTYLYKDGKLVEEGNSKAIFCYVRQ